MAKVYVVQENPRVNILAAGRYGELIPLLNPGKQITLSSAPVVRLMRQKLKDYNDDDFKQKSVTFAFKNYIQL